MHGTKAGNSGVLGSVVLSSLMVVVSASEICQNLASMYKYSLSVQISAKCWAKQ